MNILYCIDELILGGLQRIVIEKANYFADVFGYKVYIVTAERFKNERPKQPFFHLSKNVEIIALPINFAYYTNHLNLFKLLFLYSTLIIKYRKELKKILIEKNIDICISLCGNELMFMNYFKDKSKKIAEIHYNLNTVNFAVTSKHKGFIWKLIGSFRMKFVIFNTKRLDRLIVLTKSEKTEWLKTNNNITQVYNFNTITPTKTTDLESKSFISVGRLEYEKGFDKLINIWKDIVEIHPDYLLDIYGDGSQKENLQKIIDNLHLNNNVFLKGQSNNIAEEYANHYAYIMTSIYEGFGLVLVEAMSCGLPCIAFDCKSGPKEIIENNKNGFIIKAEDNNTMVKRICQLIEDKNLALRMSNNAIIRSKDFDKDKIMNQWKDLFEELVAK
jgi:glycosyltransferase involved in cell wall biosynthesis